MLNFNLHLPTKIIFGKGTEEQVGAEAALLGKKVLLHSGGKSAKASGLYDRVLGSLKAAGLEVYELPGVQPNPRLSLVRKGIELCREKGIDCIIAVGGGSTIDSSKAIGVGTKYDGDVWDFFTGKAQAKECMPIGVVLTIPAAGSEMSNSMVVTNEDGWYKRGYNTDIARVKFAIMNPELTYTLPPYQSGCGAADIMAHVMERYFTNVRDVEFTDRMCEALLKTIINNLPKVLRDPCDYAARAEIMWAGSWAHNDLLTTGREGCWACHQMEHELSAAYDVAHGAGLAVVFPAWMKYVYKHDVSRFVQFANRVFDIEIDPFDLEGTALKGIAALETFFHNNGLPVRLGELGIDDSRLAEMANKCKKNNGDGTGKFVKLYPEDIEKIYRLAL